jgi:hypothetical protein
MRALPLCFLKSMHLPSPALRVFFGLLALLLARQCAAQGQPPGASAPATPRPERVVILLGTDPSLLAVRLLAIRAANSIVAQRA